MTKVYVVWHYDQETLEDEEHEKLIGAYSTEQLAQEAIERLRDKPGFRDFPERWEIIDMVLDRVTDWAEGFTTFHGWRN